MYLIHVPQDLVVAELCHADLEGTRLFLHCSGGRRVMSCGLRRHLAFTYFMRTHLVSYRIYHSVSESLLEHLGDGIDSWGLSFHGLILIGLN